eukprot:COSAG06_NODE_31361_length_522_cov_137.189125_1_plen_43_part_10
MPAADGTRSRIAAKPSNSSIPLNPSDKESAVLILVNRTTTPRF